MNHRDGHAAGFTLVETLVAVTLLVVLASTVATLTSTSARALARARLDTTAVQLAQHRLDQLRALTWSYGSVRDPISSTDQSTDVGTAVPTGGGHGLSVSPGDALDADRSGYVDYLDQTGRWLTNVPPAPPAARFVRRWRVDVVTGRPDLLRVVVRVVDRRHVIRPVDVVLLRARVAG